MLESLMLAHAMLLIISILEHCLIMQQMKVNAGIPLGSQMANHGITQQRGAGDAFIHAACHFARGIVPL